MPEESVHHRAPQQKYTIVFIPASETGKPRRVTVGMAGLVGYGFGLFVVIVVLVISALVYTPLGLYVQIPNPELENRYRQQIVSIQERLALLTENLVALREYNVRLRKALGENISPDDSALIAQRLAVQQNGSRLRNEPSLDTRGSARGMEPATLNAGVVQMASMPTVWRAQPELPMTLPTRGYVTQEFDPEHQHFGIDFAGKDGSIISAATDGIIIFAGWTYEDGNMIMLAHGNGYRTTYKHNRALLKSAGATVRRGEPIALLGNTGKTSYGPHLHFEVWKDGIPQNPKDFLLNLE